MSIRLAVYTIVCCACASECDSEYMNFRAWKMSGVCFDVCDCVCVNVRVGVRVFDSVCVIVCV